MTTPTGDPGRPIQYNAYNQAGTIDGRSQAYNDLGNDLRVQTGGVGLVNTQFGITARTTSAGTTYYTRTPDGRLLASDGPDGPDGPDGTYFYITDYQQSVLALIGTNGQRAGNYRYAPYGDPTIVETSNAAHNTFRWHSGYYDTEGDHYYKLGARYHDADSHFTQPDPQTGRLGNFNAEPLSLQRR